MKFKNFSRTFPVSNSIFQDPYKIKKIIIMYSMNQAFREMKGEPVF